MYVVKEEMVVVAMNEEDAEDAVRWRHKICCGKPMVWERPTTKIT